MNLRLIDKSNVEHVLHWLTQKDNCQWLDFGSGTQSLHPAALKSMIEQINRYFSETTGTRASPFYETGGYSKPLSRLAESEIPAERTFHKSSSIEEIMATCNTSGLYCARPSSP